MNRSTEMLHKDTDRWIDDIPRQNKINYDYDQQARKLLAVASVSLKYGRIKV